MNETVIAKLERLWANQQQEDQPEPPNRGSECQDQSIPEKVSEEEPREEESRNIAVKKIPSEEDNEPTPAGKLVVDATCAPADIAYLVDVRLVHRARLQSEALIDELHAQRPSGSLKPRTYREKLQQKWRVFIKISKTFPVKNPGDAQDFAHGFTAQKRHLDRLLDELGVGSVKNKSLRRMWILRIFFISRWSGSNLVNLHHQESSAWLNPTSGRFFEARPTQAMNLEPKFPSVWKMDSSWSTQAVLKTLTSQDT